MWWCKWVLFVVLFIDIVVVVNVLCEWCILWCEWDFLFCWIVIGYIFKLVFF